MLGGQKYVTISDTTYHYEGLRMNLEEALNAEGITPRQKAALEAALEKLLKYYDRQCVVASISCVLDPTKNLQFLKDMEWDPVWISTVTDQMKEAFNHYKPKTTPTPQEAQLPKSPYPQLANRLKSRQTKNEDDELERYYAFPRPKEGTDILAWWKSTGTSSFPTLAKMARDYFAIPASSVASERVFSSAADICTPDRNRLEPDTVSDAMCLKMWLRNKDIFNKLKLI
jgi:hypothetical protein